MKLWMVLAFVILLVGCQPSHQLYKVSDVPYGKDRGLVKAPIPREFFTVAQELHTLDMSGEAFNTVGEWYDNESILYIVDVDGGSNVYRFNLFTGETKLFFSTETTILSMEANEDHTMFLFHLSGSRNHADLVAVDQAGTELYSWGVTSYDLDYTWNPYKADQLFLTTFMEDWTYNSSIVEIKNESTKPHQVPQPFIQWVDTTQIAYLKWNENEPSYDAPLYVHDLINGVDHLLLEHIISFSAFSDVLLTIENEKEESSNYYRFRKPFTSELLAEKKLPMLTDYSGWFIPSHDFVSSEKLFYTFKPYEFGAYDTYTKKFSLIEWSLESGTESTILEEVDALPLNFSPNGSFALYGYQFENLIDVKGKVVKPIVQF